MSLSPCRKRWRRPLGEPHELSGVRRWLARSEPHSVAAAVGHSLGLWPWLPRLPMVLVVLFLGRAALRSPPTPHMWEPQP